MNGPSLTRTISPGSNSVFGRGFITNLLQAVDNRIDFFIADFADDRKYRR